MILFNEVRMLNEISDEAFMAWNEIKSHERKDSNDVLVICSTNAIADFVFRELAKDYLGGTININKRELRTADGLGTVYVRSIGTLRSWLPGHSFKKIHFER